MTGIRNSSIAALAVAGAAIIASTGPAAAQVDPNLLLDQFEATFGKFEGYRRAGAKGVCAAGEFTGSADGRALSVSSAFSGKTVPVIVRFSVGGAGANPKAADNARSQRNMALQFNLPDGETWFQFPPAYTAAPVNRAHLPVGRPARDRLSTGFRRA